MPDYTQKSFGASIDTSEITDGAITYVKLATDAKVGVPVGAIVAWLKSFPNTPALPSGFVECDGSVLSDAGSVYNGQTLPSLNSTHYFLRGSTTSGTTGGSETHSHTSKAAYTINAGGGHDVWDYASGNNTTNTADTKPPFYEIVWLMRVK